MASLWRPDPRAAHGWVSGAAGRAGIWVLAELGHSRSQNRPLSPGRGMAMSESARQIQKLEIDKEILADQEGDADDEAAN